MSIESLIGNYAFPIIACIVMAWYIKYITDKNKEDMDNLNKKYQDVIYEYKDELKNTINNNTRVMQMLCDKIDSKIGGIQ